MTSLAPVLTIVLSLIIYHVVPNGILVTGMVTAVGAMYLMAEWLWRESLQPGVRL